MLLNAAGAASAGKDNVTAVEPRYPQRVRKPVARDVMIATITTPADDSSYDGATPSPSRVLVAHHHRNKPWSELLTRIVYRSLTAESSVRVVRLALPIDCKAFP